MTPTSTSSDGVWPCPFRGFHCCPDGEVGNKGFPRLISHLKRLHLPSDKRKDVLREAISTDHGLYMAVEKTLKIFKQWLCGKCMNLHVVSRACHHPNGLVRFSKGSDDMSGYIVGISKPSNKESGTEITEGLVFNAELLDRVFKVPITTVKCIPHGCRLAFSQALKTVLCKVVAQPDSIDAWVRLLLFPRCTLQCLRKVADEHFTVAVKVLSSSGVALYCDDTIKALEAKHLYKPPPSMPSITFSEPPLVDSVFSCIKSGRCPPILTEFVASAPLTPLLKPDNEIRPIIVGTIGRRLVSKVSMKCVAKEISKYLRDFQFGVRVSGGDGAILHSVNRVLSEYHNDWSLAMLSVDFSDAFNLVDRSALLHEIRQGDPLGPLLFAVILHPLLHNIKDSCKLLLHAWYLDDGTVIGDSEDVVRVLDIIKVSGPGLGLELNIKKTEIFWPSCYYMKLREGLFLIDIRRPSSGVKLLEGAVSRDADFISGLAMRRAVNAVDLMGLLPQLHDP
nr:putative reverse transcriptase domain-containing protein [Tanacetum cinerariifolium]